MPVGARITPMTLTDEQVTDVMQSVYDNTGTWPTRLRIHPDAASLVRALWGFAPTTLAPRPDVIGRYRGAWVVTDRKLPPDYLVADQVDPFGA
jgi:hypothetical protein